MKTLKYIIVLVLVSTTGFAQFGPPRGLHHTQNVDGTVNLRWLPPLHPGDIYFNSFDNNPDLSDWTLLPAADDWRVENGQLITDLVDEDEWGAAFYHPVDLDSYCIDVDVTMDTSPFQIMSRLESFIFVHASWPAGNPELFQSYTVKSAFSNYGAGLSTYVEFGDGNADAQQLIQRIYYAMTAESTSSVHVTVTALPPVFEVYLNNDYIGSFTDDSRPSGHPGVGVSWTSPPVPVIKFDNYSIMSYEGGPQILHYNVYRNGVLHTTTDEPFITDQLLDTGQYTYCVTAVTGTGESAFSLPTTAEYAVPDDVILFTDFDEGLPDQWTIVTSTISSNTWRISYDDPDRHAYLKSEADDGLSELNSLITPEFSLADATQASLSFQYCGFFSALSTVDAELNGNNEWITAREFTGEHAPSERAAAIDLTQFAGAENVRLRFQVTDCLGSYLWTVDDVCVADGERAPWGLNVWAIDPDVVPAYGGVFMYGLHLYKDVGAQLGLVAYWLNVLAPNGQSYRYISPFVFMPPSVFDVTVEGLSLQVPPFAPVGTYTVYAIAGQFNQAPWAADSFSFVKEPADEGDRIEAPLEWSAHVEPLQAALLQTGAVPVSSAISEPISLDYRLHRVYPNPFNSTASVSISLPETAELKVTVFNVIGQQVAELANGQFNAGVQTFTIDGSALASGIYFVKAVVQGQLNEIQKVTLMK